MRPSEEVWELPNANFNVNRSAQAADITEGYRNEWIAWNAEGTQILAHSADLQELERHLFMQGLSFQKVVLEFVSDLQPEQDECP